MGRFGNSVRLRCKLEVALITAVDGANTFLNFTPRVPFPLVVLAMTVSNSVADCGDGGASMDSCSALLTVWPTKALDTVRLAETVLQHRVVAFIREPNISAKLDCRPFDVLAEQYTL